MDKCTSGPFSYCIPVTDTGKSHRKEVEFDKGKVLLSRLGDQIHATSAFCTHYGAPLAKGVLTSDARVVWSVRSLAFSEED